MPEKQDSFGINKQIKSPQETDNGKIVEMVEELCGRNIPHLLEVPVEKNLQIM